MVRKISVILPAFNEAESIGVLIEGISRMAQARQRTDLFEIVVVDDGSTDGTGEAAERAGARVVRHPYNIGNGAAVKAGMRAAGGDLFVLMDADGQHRPEEIPVLLEALGEHAMVVGARRKAGHASLPRRIANALYNRFASYVTGRRIPDLTSGFRVVRAGVAQRFLYLLPNTFSYPTTITLACFKTGLPVTYVPIEARKRTGKSKIKVLKDGARFFLIILKIATFFSPFRVFFPLSLLSFALGTGYYLYTYFTEHRFTNMAALLIVQGVILFALALISEQIAQLRFDRSERRGM
ncbi:MAG TPA: glycosyltransferase family 2 protein [Planctomycetota bacterium]|nr:glycosyltransferase family 2 protein [Planctomycetota bacterium]